MESEKLKELFDSFLINYQEDAKNEIWTNQSREFNDFWSEKIMKSDDEELNDQEVDDIVRIIDSHGKGNTPLTESLAKVMIPQGAWRRLFNQLKEEKPLSNTIESIFTANTDDIRIESIDKLFALNEGNKNNLTGKSGNAINCMLAAYDPFENLSIVSINDRQKLLDALGINYSINSKSIGSQIVGTTNYIKEKFIEANILSNARTITKFVYSKTFVNIWKKRIAGDGIESSEESTHGEHERLVCDDFMFYMEKQLEDFLIENWDKTELGQKYDLITNDDGLVSQQYKTDIGVIDILAKDKKDGKYVIIELKKNQTSDDTIGQIARYMGWIEAHLSDGDETKGIIIAGKYDKKLKYAMRKIKGIEVYLYKVDFHLKEYTE